MDQKWIQILFDWASSNRYVTRLWIFGSRAKGTNHPDSDLDVAVEVRSWGPHETSGGVARAKIDAWQSELQRLLHVEIHLCHYDLDVDPNIHESQGNVVKSVQAGSILIYDSNSDSNTCQKS